MVRFLHTSDWQLGMTRRFFDDGAQARFAEARFEAIVRIGELAREHSAEFVVVCGDVFETNHVDRRTVSRALDSLARVTVPVYLLPGNHDPLDAGSIYRQPTFDKRRPSHVRVLDSFEPVAVREGVELVGAPWMSKRPLEDLVQRAVRPLQPASGAVRIAVAHGAVDSLSPNQDDPALIELAAAERALAEGRIHYLALGDKHSRLAVGSSGRIHYSGAPEPTDFDEKTPGLALLVDVDAEKVSTQELRIAKWSFARERAQLDSDADLAQLEKRLTEELNKPRTALKLDLVGSLTIRQKARLDELLELQRDDFAALIAETSRTDLAIVAEDSDFGSLGLAGFGARAVEKLRELAAVPDEEGARARDALALLVRLAERDA